MLEELKDYFMKDEKLQLVVEVFEEIINASDDQLDDFSVEVLLTTFQKRYQEAKQEILESVSAELINNYSDKEQIVYAMDTLLAEIKEEINAVSAPKQKLFNGILQLTFDIINEAIEQTYDYKFVLPIKLDEGAQVPTYAHSSDAAADLYAAKDMTIPAHSISNMVPTGVHIELPKGWSAIIVPRSSMGMKTGLRLSNSEGIIDSDYRGPLGVIYDNISDSDYEIKQGDRIAQMYLMPVYHFKPKIVDQLNETERGENGYGSTGK